MSNLMLSGERYTNSYVTAYGQGWRHIIWLSSLAQSRRFFSLAGPRTAVLQPGLTSAEQASTVRNNKPRPTLNATLRNFD